MRIAYSAKRLKELLELQDQAGQMGKVETVLRVVAVRQYILSGGSFSQVAEYVGEAISTVARWVKEYLWSGMKSFYPRKSPGRPKVLSSDEEAELQRVLQASPTQQGFVTGCWTARVVNEWLVKNFNKSLSLKYLPELLKRLGFSYKKASNWFALRDDQARLDWMEQQWTEIQAFSEQTGGSILFMDEASFCTGGNLGYSWGPKGKPIEVPSSCRRDKVNAIAAFDMETGKVTASFLQGTIDSDQIIRFLQKLLKKNDGPLTVIVDNARVHKSRKIRDFLDTVKGRLHLLYLPAYSPDLNPIEKLWSELKTKHVANLYFDSPDALEDHLINAIKMLNRQPFRNISWANQYHEMNEDCAA